MLRMASCVATDYPVELWLRTKVQNEPELEIGRFEVVVKLSSSGPVDVPGRLRFYDQFLVYNQVESLGSEFLTLVKDVNWHFPRNSVSSLEKLPLKRRYVEPFEEAESEVVVNLIKRSNHRMGELPLEKLDARHKQNKCCANPPNHHIRPPKHLSPLQLIRSIRNASGASV